MASLGFTYYDEIPTPEVPTISELVAALTAQERGDILEGFTKKIIPERLTDYIRERFNRTFKPKKAVVIRLYRAIDSIEERAREYMRGEVLITPAVIDPDTGEVIEEAVYNTPVETANELLTTIQDEFSEDFSSAQVQAILSKMVNYSKHDGTGDWTFYKTEVVK